ncbi:hypothetical protein GOP47_0009785 [Adiantum capillus-veneris]|uniref:Uncharacterized protein n=1 Tax=Adiantum capillus-veneris TaxID=13818 RepID=A0A9D4UX94_ADICA|nr:hypothetical protein GOP47_0009785 [Adiantum capillus-veneris]
MVISLLMGDHQQSTRRRTHPQQLGLRRRYLALLVPALARVHVAHPLLHNYGSGQLARARAVRRAADTCLIEAMSTSRIARDQQIRAAARRRRACSSSLQRSSFSYKLLGKAKAKAKSNSWRQRRHLCARAASRRIIAHSGQMNGAPDYRGISSGLSTNHAGGEDEEEESWIPNEGELQRLQRAIFPAQATDYEDNDDPSNPCSGTKNNLMSNPATLLSQAAQYIMALQVQV